MKNISLPQAVRERLLRAEKLGHHLGTIRVLQCEHGHMWVSVKCLRCGQTCSVGLSLEHNSNGTMLIRRCKKLADKSLRATRA